MNFEDAFKHYKEGSATDEEKALVLDELAKAKALSSLMDDEALAVNPAPLAEADVATIKAAKKQFKMKNLIIAGCSVCAVLLSVGAILGGVFGSAASYAKKQANFDKNYCAAQAKIELCAFLDGTSNDNPLPLPFHYSPENLEVEDVDADFHFEADLKSSFYSYKVELKTPDGTEYTVGIDTRDGRRVGKISIG